MKSSVEPIEGTENGNQVKVLVEIDETEFEEALEHAWQHIAKEVRMPGFRPGKAPRRLLEQRLGKEYGRAEALREYIPVYYSRAVNELEVDVIDAPELDITSGREEGPVAFEAVVAVRPEITVAGYNGLRVEIQGPEPSEDDIDEQIDRLRGQYGELTTVERPIERGDYVTIDVAGTQGGEPLDGLTAEDYMYEVGSGMIVAEFDEHLEGAKVGDEVTFAAEHPDPEEDEVAFRLTVKEVKERVLPELTDEWVADATEFETVAELRQDTRERLTQIRSENARTLVRARIGEELSKLVEDEIPAALVRSEMEARVENLARQVQARGLTMEQYLQLTGQDVDAFRAELESTSLEAVKIDLALRHVAAMQDLVPSDDELTEEIGRIAAQVEIDVEDAREQLKRAGQIPAVRSDLTKRRAIEWLVEHSEVVDEEGNPVDPEALKLPEADASEADTPEETDES